MPGLTNRDRWLLDAPGRELRIKPRLSITSRGVYLDVTLMEHGEVVLTASSNVCSVEAETEALEEIQRLGREDVA